MPIGILRNLCEEDAMTKPSRAIAVPFATGAAVRSAGPR